ncbi:unnamed protein product [Prunus armeniaca]|uniref:Endonuclease/exonuclease/phosphatase domain-containing protein n=1 Tax=Prunus armeniaca TaxID=36596 RepID=A0A6J5UZ61_PRUAR|nr:unnamed protein product [Prunus armeniaca]
MDAFKDVVNNCALCEVNYIRPHFTWWNGREGNVMVEERLDRALVTDDVLESFPQAKVVHLISDSSGHHPISLELGLNESKFSCTRKGRRRVHFEEFWVEESSCSDVIIDAWNSRNLEEVSLLHKIELCGQRLDCWNKNRFGNIPRRLKQGRFCRNFSRSLGPLFQGRGCLKLVSGSYIGWMSEKPQDPSRIPRNLGRVLSVVVRNVNGELMGAMAKPIPDSQR